MKEKQRITREKEIHAIDLKLRKFYLKKALLELEEHFLNDGWALNFTTYKPSGLDSEEFKAFLKENGYRVKARPEGLVILGKVK